jgi:FkbM family methyltransferase
LQFDSILRTLNFIVRHPLASKRPLIAFWRNGRWQIESRLRAEIEVNWIGGAKLVARNGMTGATGNIYCGLHEFADMSFLLHLLRPNDLFVDIGANIGSFTVLSSAVCGARSIAVEPDPDTVRSLERNIEINGIASLATVVRAALGASAGVARFTIGHDTTNQVVTEGGTNTREVPIRTLDEVLDGRQPTAIKMDVEGYEPEVIAGAARALREASLLAVITETVDARMRSDLEGVGFLTAKYEPFTRRLELTRSEPLRHSNNVLFVRDPEACRKRIASAARRSIVGVTL